MFEFLKKYEVTADLTAWYDMPELGEEARILVHPASEANPKFHNEVLRGTAKGGRLRKLAAGQVSAQELKKSRKEDRRLYPEHVIAGWEKVIDEPTGKEIPFSKDAAQQLCDQLPPELFDSLRVFASTAANFYPVGKEPADPAADPDGAVDLTEN